VTGPIASPLASPAVTHLPRSAGRRVAAHPRTDGTPEVVP